MPVPPFGPRPGGALVPRADLFGVALLDYLNGARSPVHMRRSDGRLARLDLVRFFSGYDFFSELERVLLEHAAGDVLDLGAGAGRVALYLQEIAGLKRPSGQPIQSVLAVDSSTGACDCLRGRGVVDVCRASWTDLGEQGIGRGGFDTVVLFGAGLGMAATPDALPRMLDRLRRVLRPGGKAIVTATASSDNLRSVRLRLEYRNMIGEWFDWLEVPPARLMIMAAEHGFVAGEDPAGNPADEYGVVLCRK